MVKVIGWKIWYGYSDGSTFSSLQGFWEEAPDQNIQVLMIYYDKKDGQGRSYRTVYCGDDMYWKNNKNEFGTSFEDTPKENDVIKYGKWIDSKEFEKIRLKAMEDYSI